MRHVAAVNGRSTAAILRDAVRAYLQEATQTPQDPFRPIIGAYTGGPNDAAQEHDRYLYHEDSERERET